MASEEDEPFEYQDPFDYKSPFDKDQLDKKPLSEKDFIHEPPPTASSLPIWLWVFLGTALIALLWGGVGLLQNTKKQEKLNKPFLEVTNREFSGFLWQFPAFFRSYVQNKTGYLSDFQHGEGQTLVPSAAENFVDAPPSVLFLYHTWQRLLAQDDIARPITAAEFLQFLAQVEEWKSEYWPEAPAAYKTWLKDLHTDTPGNLADLSAIPLVVKQAFFGWKNYFKEGQAINELNPTVAEIKAFLEKYPHYGRSYWRNIDTVLNHRIAGLNYLADVQKQELDTRLPLSQMSSFLKVALFNYQQAQQGL